MGLTELLKALHGNPQSLAQLLEAGFKEEEDLRGHLSDGDDRKDGPVWYYHDVLRIAGVAVKIAITKTVDGGHDRRTPEEYRRTLRSMTPGQLTRLAKLLKEFRTDEVMSRTKGFRIWARTDEVDSVRERYAHLFADSLRLSGQRMARAVLGGMKSPAKKDPDPLPLTEGVFGTLVNLTPAEREHQGEMLRKIRKGFYLRKVEDQHPLTRLTFGRGRGEVLHFFYAPPTIEVLTAQAANALRLWNEAEELHRLASEPDLQHRLDPWLDQDWTEE